MIFGYFVARANNQKLTFKKKKKRGQVWKSCHFLVEIQHGVASG